jgi:hypothetical protein
MLNRNLTRRFAGAAVAVAFAAATLLATSSSALAWVRIEDYNSKLVVTVFSTWAIFQGTQVELQPYSVNDWRTQWLANPKGFGTETFEFENKGSHQCLDASSQTSGAAVVQNPCDDTLSQKWIRWQDPDQPVWRIFNYWSGHYLAVDNGATAAGTGLVQLPYSRLSDSQKFQMY